MSHRWHSAQTKMDGEQLARLSSFARLCMPFWLELRFPIQNKCGLVLSEQMKCLVHATEPNNAWPVSGNPSCMQAHARSLTHFVACNSGYTGINCSMQSTLLCLCACVRARCDDHNATISRLYRTIRLTNLEA